MAEATGIQWTDATWNPWRGCTKVSPGCANCYAETVSKRNPSVLGEWGPGGKRAVAAESYWRQPLRWNRKAEQEGRRLCVARKGATFSSPTTTWRPAMASCGRRARHDRGRLAQRGDVRPRPGVGAAGGFGLVRGERPA